MVDNVKDFQLERFQNTDPSLPSTAPKRYYSHEDFEQTGKKTFLSNFYNRETKEYCGRSCVSWISIIAYGLIYLMFVTTFTLVLLYTSLQLLKRLVDFKVTEPELFIYPEGGIGLTAIPTSEESYPLIWYKRGGNEEYKKYIQAIDRFFLNSKENDTSTLGPCGEHPYGYGDSPCVIIKINKQFNWAGKPLQLNSTSTGLAPAEVVKWMTASQDRLWLQCGGYHSYDKEHIGKIRYYPDPPGFDPASFPLDADSKSPLVAIQITGFTIGISLAIECKLWYENGPSRIDFVVYVAPDDSISFAGQTSVNV